MHGSLFDDFADLRMISPILMSCLKTLSLSAARQPRTLQSGKKGKPSALAVVHGVRLPRSFLARNDKVFYWMGLALINTRKREGSRSL